MKRLTCFTAVLALALTSTVAFAADNIKRADKSFITDTYENGLAEVSAAEMAKRKTGHADVKAFAEQMATDHGKTNAELKTLADNKKVEVAAEPTMVAQGKAKLLDRKTGAEFDKEYVADAVKSHQKSVASFEKAANEAEDADVKAFAAKVLPTLKHHLSMAEELQKKVGQ